MKEPVLIELDTAPASPAEAAPIDMPNDLPEGRAMQIATRLGARPASRLMRFFWQAGGALVGFLASVALWRFVDGLFATHPLLGWAGAALIGLFVLAALMLALREITGFARLRRLDRVHREVRDIRESDDLARARKAVAQVSALYAGRREMDWSRRRLAEQSGEVLDASTLLTLTERELMAPLDAAARLEIEAASRTVATVTALVPLALADVVTALTANLRMIRRIAEIYGGRSGSLGSLRLARSVMTHVVATGAVAAGDDLIETLTGGHLMSKISRRFGEGVINGALTARVGVAALEVCRPMPFHALEKPKVKNLIGRSLVGVFDRKPAD